MLYCEKFAYPSVVCLKRSVSDTQPLAQHAFPGLTESTELGSGKNKVVSGKKKNVLKIYYDGSVALVISKTSGITGTKKIHNIPSEGNNLSCWISYSNEEKA